MLAYTSRGHGAREIFSVIPDRVQPPDAPNARVRAPESGLPKAPGGAALPRMRLQRGLVAPPGRGGANGLAPHGPRAIGSADCYTTNEKCQLNLKLIKLITDNYT